MHKDTKPDKDESKSLIIVRRLFKVINVTLSTIVIFIILLIAACTTYALISNNNVYKKAKSIRDDLLKLKPNYEEAVDVRVKFEKLRKINPDVCAWLTIDNTTIDCPIVQGEDNLKYINMDAYGNFALEGSIFLDSRCDRNFTGNYSLVYGHHMVKHMVFGDLDYYKEKDFFEKNRTGMLILPDRAYKLNIYACMIIYSSDKVFDPPYYNKNILKLIEYAKKDGLYVHEDVYNKIKNNPNVQILTLSTCATDFSEARTVVFAVMDLYKTYDDSITLPDTVKPNTGDSNVNIVLIVIAASFTFAGVVTIIAKKKRKVTG